MERKETIVSEIYRNLVEQNYHVLLLKGGHTIRVMEPEADYEIKIVKKKDRTDSSHFEDAKARSYVE